MRKHDLRESLCDFVNLLRNKSLIQRNQINISKHPSLLTNVRATKSPKLAENRSEQNTVCVDIKIHLKELIIEGTDQTKQSNLSYINGALTMCSIVT